MKTLKLLQGVPVVKIHAEIHGDGDLHLWEITNTLYGTAIRVLPGQCVVIRRDGNSVLVEIERPEDS